MSDLTPERESSLRRLAEAATPGQWMVRRLMREPSLDDKLEAHMSGAPVPDAIEVGCFVQAPRLKPTDPYDIEVLGDDRNEELYPTWRADVDYIAAANPATMLELLDALAAERQRVAAAIAAYEATK
jgi:hypothetical protein